MMKTKFVLLLLLLPLSAVFAQKQKFEIKGTIDQKLQGKKLYFTRIKMYGTPKPEAVPVSVANGAFLQWMLYINEDNKLYSKMSNSEAIFWNDGAINKDQVTKVEVNKGIVTVLGYLCDELILTTSGGIEKYYFNTKIGVDPKVFQNHKFGNWSEVVSKSKALPLKVMVDNQQFTMESIAVEIVPMTLDDKLFALPADAKLEKSPF